MNHLELNSLFGRVWFAEAYARNQMAHTRTTPLFPARIDEAHARIARLWDELERCAAALDDARRVILFLDGELVQARQLNHLYGELLRAASAAASTTHAGPQVLQVLDAHPVPAHESRVDDEDAAVSGTSDGLSTAAVAEEEECGTEYDAYRRTRQRQRQWQSVVETTGRARAASASAVE